MSHPLPSPTYLTDKQVAARYGVSRVTPWRWAKESDFPNPVQLTTGCTRWELVALEKWESTRSVQNNLLRDSRADAV